MIVFFKRLLNKLIRDGYLNMLPDKLFITLQFWVNLGHFPNLKKPRTFNEKMQWLKLHDRNEMYTKMVDKYEVKFEVAKLIGPKHIIPTLGVWDNFEDICFDELPNQFVLKCTHDSGTVVICKDKNKFDRKTAKEIINRGLKSNYYFNCREWPYKNVKPRIIAEEYLSQDGGIVDYKFFCFSGKAKYLYVSKGLDYHPTARISFVNINWEDAGFGRSDYKAFEVLPPRPQHLSQMIEIAESLSHDSIFLRVDLYEVNNKIYFSELTYTPCGGYLPFYPNEWDTKLGNLISVT